MNIAPSDVAIVARGRRAFNYWRWQVWVQLAIGVVALAVGLAGQLSTSNAMGLCGVAVGVLCSTSLQYLQRFQALLVLAERAVNSSPQGISLLASDPPKYVA